MGVWKDVSLKMDVTLRVCLTYGEPSILLFKMYYCLFAGLLLKHSWHAHVSEHSYFQFSLLPSAIFGLTASHLKPLLQAHLFNSATESGPGTVTLLTVETVASALTVYSSLAWLRDGTCFITGFRGSANPHRASGLMLHEGDKEPLMTESPVLAADIGGIAQL